MKKFTAILCTALMAFTLTACGGKKASVSVDADKLAGELLETVTTDTLSKSTVNPSTVYFYNESDVANAFSYASSGATACEIAVIESKDAAKTGEIEKLLQTRVDNQAKLYATYNAAEADKLGNALIKSAGVYTVLCVSDDMDKAAEILKSYGF